MRILLVSVFGASLAIYSGGCTVHESGGISAGVEVDTPSVEVDTPVIEGAGAVEIDTEPPPAERVYVYDEGFPPGVYLYGGYYYYNGYRYDHDVFVNRYVHENITHHRFVNVEENRRQGRQIEARHKTEFQKTGGKHQPHNARPAEHKAVEHKAPEHNAAEHPAKPEARHEAPVQHPQNPAEHHEVTPKHENLNEHPAKPAERPGEVKHEEHVKPNENPARVQPKGEKKEERKDEKKEEK